MRPHEMPSSQHGKFRFCVYWRAASPATRPASNFTSAALPSTITCNTFCGSSERILGARLFGAEHAGLI